MEPKFSLQIFRVKKKTHISNYIKICPTGAKFFHVDGNDEAVVVFCNLGNASKTNLK
jgi:hypothetical protein